MNIPIYRAKKINSDEFIEGYLIDVRFIFKEWIDDVWTSFGETKSNKALVYEIDPTTLAIHFPDIIDSQGNKIFASLNKDGKGGDIMKDDEYYGIAKYADSRFVVEYENVEECLCEGNFEIVGIQE